MAGPYSDKQNTISQSEHISPAKTGDNIEAKKVANYVWNNTNSQWERETQPSGGGGGAVTIADGADVAEGATTDATVAAGATGTVSAKLRRVTTDLDAVKTSAASVDGKLPTLTSDGNVKTEVIESVPTMVSGTNVTSNGADIIASTEVKGRAVTFQATGFGTATIQLQWSNDNSNFVAGTAMSIANATSPSSTSITANGIYMAPVEGRYLRVRTSAYTSGTLNGTLAIWSSPPAFPSVGAQINGTQTEDAASGADGGVGITVLGVRNDAAAALTSADGDWGRIALDSAGRVGIADLGGSITVDGTVTATPSGTQDENLAQVNGIAVNTGTGAAGTGTQRVAVASDSSITANAGTNLNTSALALSATQTDRTQKTQITDGTRDGTVKAASTLPLATDTAVVVTQRDGLPAGSNAIGKLAANDGVDIGDVTINNASGASAVNIQDGGNSITVDGTVTATPSGTYDENIKQVNGVAVNVGTGAAGTGTQRVAVASDSSINAVQSGTWNITNVSGTVSLPTGAATSANQSTEITSLQLLDDVPAAQNAAFSKGTPVMGQLDDTSTTVATEDNVAAVRITAQRGIHTNLRNVSGTEIATSSNPIRTDPTGTTTQPVSATSLPLPTGAATETTLGTRLSESDFDTKTGSLTETAPATDTASSGLNGRLQRIAQRLTSLIALLPTSLGQKTKANSLAVTIASDQDALPVTDNAGSITVDAPVGTPVNVQVGDGSDTAEVNARTDGIKALEVNDDFTSFEAQHTTLSGSTDTTITFAQAVRMVMIKNWDTTNRVLVKDGAISSNTDASASRVGIAPTANVPGKATYVFKTNSVHLRSAGASEVTVEGYF